LAFAAVPSRSSRNETEREARKKAAEAAFDKAIAKNFEEANIIKRFKLRNRLWDLLHYDYFCDAKIEAEAAIAADQSSFDAVIVAYLDVAKFIDLQYRSRDTRKMRLYALDLAKKYNASPALVDKILSALGGARSAEDTLPSDICVG
jgi:hypothetical protein